MTRPDRHRFVTLKRSWRDGADISACGMARADRLLDWVDAGRPLVVASSAPGDEVKTVRLGLSTPQKQRFGLRVQTNAIDDILPAVRLNDAAVSAPPSWKPTIDAILEVVEQHELDLSVFGSLAWSHLSGEDHLRPTSDLDILVSTPVQVDARVVIQALLAIESMPRLDGELVLTSGAGVNLREYARQPEHILTKQHGGPQLVPLATLESVAGRAP
ncbi:malonate decarboxylase holo-[acyl-carrier-protein] synthase [Rhizobium skierniewicense]|uniref:malonate decarboxylase holo-[acyl-carrier-protein] synthase n=1 Tax=Rhizobium skierniewicense TaxID=984260 RepID=UPI00157206EF|nr:malonate decarboxylase holo-[acyl-carrier-protein] synthase [Rhizobium skierniewicense]NTF34200.1 malonate decarboxylase holo-[acyl-carrier-protein] synthase [Rhizobium skierniewicense]